MRKVFLAAGLALWLCSCGDDRPTDAGAGTPVSDSTNATVGAGNSGATSKGDSANLQNGNAAGQAVDSGGRQNTTRDSTRKGQY
jgi:hypothetical protein